jgi:caffeoyl-CoA O-methyltransferase
MTTKTLTLTQDLYRYLLAVSLREPDVLARLRAETAALPEHNMQIAPEQGQFMAFLLKLMGATRVLEIGTFTGYSALAMALALPADGRLVACDVSRTWTAIARRYWREAGVEERIDLRIAPAIETLDALMTEGQAGRFDFVFIDADKESYRGYFECALHLVRPGGVIAIDNAFWGGAVVHADESDSDAFAIDSLNRALHEDPRIDLTLLPIGDGLMLARKRG